MAMSKRRLGRNSDDVDTAIAKAAKKVIVTVEKIVRHEEVVRRPTLTYIPHHWVTAIVETPTGAHPGNCDTLYEADFDALGAYLASFKSPRHLCGLAGSLRVQGAVARRVPQHRHIACKIGYAQNVERDMSPRSAIRSTS